jgi:polyhydroxyalkanoate synthesis regulator phasin
VKFLGELRRRGVSWEQIKDQSDKLVDDIREDGTLPFSNEAEQYVQRMLCAAYAKETSCN